MKRKVGFSGGGCSGREGCPSRSNSRFHPYRYEFDQPIGQPEDFRHLKTKGSRDAGCPCQRGRDRSHSEGTLAIMVGGEKRIFEECLEIFQALGKSIVYVGGIGSGGYVKLVNQIIVALNIATLGEAFSLGVKAVSTLK